jgi:hypothetical protein
MFQYAVGRHLSLIHNTELKLDVNSLLDRTPNPNVTYRNFDLDIFLFKPIFANKIDILRVKSERILKPLRNVFFFIPDYSIQHINEKGFNFDINVLNSPNNSYLDGYWQSEKYFSQIQSIIREDFKIRGTVNKKILDSINNSDSICLNVRRGDYISNPITNAFHGVYESDYFYKAVNILLKKVENPEIFIFSDDINWCQNNLKFEVPTEIIFHEYAGKKFEKYLKLMSSCKHFIIPNSTFGWWAAWLSQNSSKIVISPKKWFKSDNWLNGKKIIESDIIPEKWMRI